MKQNEDTMVKGIIYNAEFYLSNTQHYHAYGVITGHPTIPDGHHINTSRITDMGITKDGAYIIILTKNSVYLLDTETMDLDIEYLSDMFLRVNGDKNIVLQ